YLEVLHEAPFGLYFSNSVLTTLIIIAAQLASSIFAAYAFARMTFKGKQLLFFLVLATMMIPIQVTFIPNFLIIKQFGWFDTYMGLIAPFSANAFGIFMIRQAFMQVPKELEEAAKLDGCNHFQIITNVMIPLSAASILTFTLLSFIWHYNDFFWPLIATNSESLRTLQVGLSSMISEEGGAKGTQWNLVMAASSLIIFPLIVIFMLVQKHIVKGIATTGLK
ncbi:MAG: ABC transporter permease, partial [Paenibacillus sp. RIFOXYA1_FULL_44_5]